MQAAVGINCIAGVLFFTQVQRWRLGAYDTAIPDISITDPTLWQQYEREIKDSIAISALREEELRVEAAERTAAGLPPHNTAVNSGRVVRKYVIDGRERVVSFFNTNPVQFGEQQKEWREKREREARGSGKQQAATAATAAVVAGGGGGEDCCSLPLHARINDGKSPAPTHPITATRGGGLVPIP